MTNLILKPDISLFNIYLMNILVYSFILYKHILILILIIKCIGIFKWNKNGNES